MLFNPKVIEHTTIVRTRFPKFRDSDAIKNDCDKLRIQKGAGSRIIEHVKRIIHVDNPPQEYPGWMETRAKSRDILVNHLAGCEAVCKPPELDEVNERIAEQVEKKQASDSRLEKLEKKLARHVSS